MTAKRARELIRRMAGRRIVVIGDIMLDHYIVGDVRRISPEAPVPVVEHRREQFLPGGAANVGRNLAALGARVRLLGVAGDDANAGPLRRVLAEGGMDARSLVVEPGRPTTVKTRVLAGHQQMIRVDRESRQALTKTTRAVLLERLRSAAGNAEAIIVADYAKGAVDQEIMDHVLSLGRRHAVPVCIDPKPARHLRMTGCALLTPNRRETFELAGMDDEPVGDRPAVHPGLLRAMAIIRRAHAPRELLVTLGEAGMLVQDKDGKPRHLPTVARDVYDVSGAGDTVIAVAALARAGGASLLEAATLANRAAGVVVGKLGTAAVTPAELLSGAR
ncbi:MAG: bifunctional heptose 7-phosphate kinase/heptose 1-phosphate adenyltransferase [Verrucomicrobiota bacterium]